MYGIPILIFLCIHSLIPSVTYFFTPGEKIRNNLKVKLHEMCLRGQGQSVESEKYMSKWAYTL